MNRITLVTLATFVSCSILAQPDKDPKAKVILENLSNKSKSYNTISASFEYKMENKDQGINETQPGSLLLKGNKYILKMAGQEVYFNEKYVWRFIPDANEVNKDCAPDPEEEEDNLLNPSNIFSIYEKGFKYSYVKETTLNNVKVDVINLYPEKADEKPYHTIILNINKEKMEIVSMVVKSKDGNTYTTTLSDFKTNVPANDGDFTFDESKADDVIDLCD